MEKFKSMVSKIGELFWSSLLVGGAVVFAAFILINGLHELSEYSRWNEYEQTKAEVRSLELYGVNHTASVQGMPKVSTTWTIGGTYRYQVGERLYKGEGAFESFALKEDAQEAMLHHYVGEKIDVWYHPATPQKTLLDYEKPTLGNSVWFILLGSIILYVVGSMIYSGIKERRRSDV